MTRQNHCDQAPGRARNRGSLEREGLKLETRILIVDDSSLVRTRLRQMLQQHPHWRVCGEASDGRDALDKVKASAPDLIVLDFRMPGMDGLETARRLGQLVPRVPILLFSMHISPQLIDEARHAGIRGMVSKSDPRRLVEGVEAVLRNEPYFAFANPAELAGWSDHH